VLLVARFFAGDAAVFGLPDPVLGQRVAAAVQLSSGVGDTTLGVILSDTRKQLADYKARERRFAVDAVPRNPFGKVDRRALAMLDRAA
jgi:acyl-CoA synthetase (AMP-forming)/AMP-acid ligase II